MSIVPETKQKDPDLKQFSKNELIFFAEMVAGEEIKESDVAAYYNSVFKEE